MSIDDFGTVYTRSMSMFPTIERIVRDPWFMKGAVLGIVWSAATCIFFSYMCAQAKEPHCGFLIPAWNIQALPIAIPLWIFFSLLLGEAFPSLPNWYHEVVLFISIIVGSTVFCALFGAILHFLVAFVAKIMKRH